MYNDEGFHFELSLGGGDISVLSSSHFLPQSLVQSRIAIHHMPNLTWAQGMRSEDRMRLTNSYGSNHDLGFT